MKIPTLTEYAKESVTARGRPSGTATTSTVTPMIKWLTKYSTKPQLQGTPSMANFFTENFTMSISTVNTAMPVPVGWKKEKIRVLMTSCFI